MAGSALSAGILAVTATLAVGLVAVGGAAVASQRAVAAADAAALAASDVASGAVPATEPACAVAARVAEAAGARLTGCVLDGVVATVTVVISYAGVGTEARARAGPPTG